MKVVCCDNTSKVMNSFHFETGYTSLGEFHVKKGNEYNVYGIVIWGGIACYLVIDENRQTSVYPAELFEIIDSSIPENWHFRFNGLGLFKVNAIFGYERLVNDPAHYNALVEHEDSAMEYFFREIYPCSI